MTISRELAEWLRLGRQDFNRRVSEAHHRFPGFDSEQFSQFMRQNVSPLLSEVAAERRGNFVSAAFDMGLELVGRELCGAHARGALLDQFWRDVLPVLAPLLPHQPAPLLNALCNALLNVHAQGARADQWLQLLREHGPQVPASALVDFGVLAAWRAGAAQYRAAALRVAPTIPTVARALLGLPEDRELVALLQLLEKDPWLLAPAPMNATLRDIGAFTGFGGHFAQPPVVRACAEGFVIESGDRYFLLLADCFGEILLPASRAEFCAAADFQVAVDQPPRLEASRLIGARGQADIDFCPEGLQLVWNAHTAALFSPYSFSFCVVPWR